MLSHVYIQKLFHKTPTGGETPVLELWEALNQRFFAITPTSPLTWIVVLVKVSYMGQIDLLGKFLVLNWNT